VTKSRAESGDGLLYSAGGTEENWEDLRQDARPSTEIRIGYYSRTRPVRGVVK